MSLEIVNNEAQTQECLTQQSIYKAIADNAKIVFNAGAGAGKTYSLIESLKYVIAQFGSKLIANNQKIICVTYTNTAVQEIHERLGNSDLVLVSTIHTRLWDFIKDYRRELLEIHKENLNKKVNELLYTLNDDESKSEFAAYRSLNDTAKESLQAYLLSNKDRYYKYSDKPAAQFKASFNSDLNCYPNIIKNVANFKKTASIIYRISNYRNCLQKIAENHEEHRKVEYDSKYNDDILHKMIISHDTVIEYAHKMFDNYGLIRRIIIDRYPYILIDEYQDTNCLVVKIIKLLHQYSEEKKLPLFIGYFGDPVQNIYDDGIGIRLSEVHSELLSIDKKHNRRSHIEIIDVINRIRGDNILQESIYDDCNGGSVKFYTAQNRNEETIKSFINKYREQWSASIAKPLHCLVLTNKTVAEYSGFPDVFNKINSTDFYRKRFQQAGTEILSHELGKLGKIPLIFYNILNLKSTTENPKTTISKVIKDSTYKDLSFGDLKKLFSFLVRLSGATLNEYVQSIFRLYAEANCPESFKSIVNNLLKLHDNSLDCFHSFLLDTLFPNLDTEKDEETAQAKDHIRSILDISIEQFIKWFHYINETQNSDVVYHTYHGTKGREYENVVIIMENDFGVINKNKFSSFFSTFTNQSALIEEKEIQKFNNTRNLLYVSCSRAIRNLRILYLDATTSFNDSVLQIFGHNNTYPS